ncbi:MAG: hypothetical protein NTY35_03090 [Planctomycetota bacterium]|nr:hypothetical protein [Planctomycetota bacterium]
MSLKASYPVGEALGGIGIPGNTRAVVAQGATLTVIDLTTIDSATGMPRELQSIEIPDVSPMALSYRLGSQGERQVFIAGGSTGLWRIDLCDALFTSASPPPCIAVPTRVDRVGCEARFAWKRCVDVAFVEGNSGAGGDALLLALFSASSDVSKRDSIRPCENVADLGATELRAYRVAANGTIVPHASCLLSPLNVNPTGAGEELGLALATDPGDPNVVYVSVGWGGIRKVDLTTATFVVTPIPLGLACGLPDFPLGGGPGCPAGEQVRDLAVVRTSALGTLVYAAMEHGRVAEVQFLPGGSFLVSTLPLGAYFPNKIAATAVGDEVLVAVGLHKSNGLGSDSSAPARTTGVWTDMCIQVGIRDPNNVNGLPQVVNEIRFLTRNATSALAPLASTPSVPVDQYWNALEFLPTTIPGRVRLYASTAKEGLRGLKAVRGAQPLAWTISPAWTGGLPFQGVAFSAGDPTVSLLSNAIGGAGFDGLSRAMAGRMFAITASAGVTDLRPIPNTNSACPIESQAYPSEQCPNAQVKLADPTPFAFQPATSSAHWIDPYDPLRRTEWFVSGDNTTNWFADPSPCQWLLDGTQCVPDPCPSVPTPGGGHSFWAKRAIPGSVTDVGWMVARLRTGGSNPATVTGLDMDLDWWQLPTNNASPNEKSVTTPYTTSTADPRTIPVGPSAVPVPKFIHLVRNGAVEGIKIVRTQWLMDRASAATPTCPMNVRGNGEPLASPAPPVGWAPGNDLQMLSVPTRVDVLAPNCSIRVQPVDCLGGASAINSARILFSNKAHIFSVPDPNVPGLEHTVLAVASGFVATSVDGTNNLNCAWGPYYRRALTVFLDITNLDVDPQVFLTQPLPPVLGAGLGPDPAAENPSQDESTTSHSYSVRTKQYASPGGPRTFAYVADLLGRVLVYDVSWDKLKPPGSPVPNPLPGYTNGAVLLPLHAVHRFPTDPFDGRRPNCTDLEIDQGVLYCATSRAGIYLLEIGSIPVASLTAGFPTYAFLDTPGVATGITFRRADPPNTQLDQMLVGDNRCGLRLYSRIGN